MHEAQAEWVLLRAPSPDPANFNIDDFDLPGQIPDNTDPPLSPTPRPSGSTTAAAASAPPQLRVTSPLPDSPASPEPQSPAESLDKTFLIVWADDSEALLLVSASPPRSLGRSFARLIPPRLPSQH